MRKVVHFIALLLFVLLPMQGRGQDVKTGLEALHEVWATIDHDVLSLGPNSSVVFKL